MQRGSWAPIVVWGLLLLSTHGASPLAAGEEELIPLDVKVVADVDGKPIGNASVYVTFREVHRFWKDKERRWDSKTNAEGLVRFPGVPAGKVQIQVVAEGWKLFGKWYEIREVGAQGRHLIEIKLVRPRRWY